ncbi:MAG: chemotaxis protein CheA [Spirochaetes bacterium]|jgi:two-component system chemotaxis sensor kinase CheA|nr:chemotaxis protein CheA [Spirochaetota bacterium]
MSDQIILEVFHNEAREIIENIESELVSLEESYDHEKVNSLFRYFHTLKGSSGIAGLTEVSEFTHEIESLLDRVRSEEIEVTSRLIDTILASVDLVKVMIFDEDQNDNFQLQKEKILTFIGKTPASSSNRDGDSPTPQKRKMNYFRVKITFKEDVFEYGIDPLLIIEDLTAIGTVVEEKIYRSRVPALDEINPQKCYLSWMFIIGTKYNRRKLDEIFIFVFDDNDIEITDITEDYNEDITHDINDDKKIGNILVHKGFITEDELLYAMQNTKGEEKIGQALVRLKLVSEKDIQNALGLQVEVRKKIESTTIRVERAKLDGIMNLLGEIVIGQSSIVRFADELDEDKAYALKNSLYGLNRSTRQFQEQIMAMRMIPVGPTFSQFKRFVRDTSKQIGKEIRLEIKGKETELDKTVIEEIADPLKHMIRNSIDHGIESIQERTDRGKYPTGVITLNAYHQEGSIFIEISDDGKGLDVNELKEIAINKGLIAKEKEITDDEVYALIFKPGFSTSNSVGDLSGRGVGMDVVKSNIDSLRGSVQILTEKGAGTTFRIKLPLTLAIIDGMLIKVGQCVYIIPLLSIIESIQPKKEEVKTIKGQGEVVLVRNEYITLIRMYKFFDQKPMFENPWEALVVIVESNGEKLALMIDDLIGQQQIVIKSLDTNVTNNRSISGAAILGDGNVSLIIDIHGLLYEISALRS